MKVITIIQTDININIITGIQNTGVITNRNKSHSWKTHNRTHHSRHNRRSRVNEIEEFSECTSDCTDLSDYEEQVNTETPDNSKN